jgi:hypothetical protein
MKEKETNITQIRVEKWDGSKYTPIMTFGYKEKTELTQLLIDMLVTICRKEGYKHIYNNELKKL